MDILVLSAGVSDIVHLQAPLACVQGQRRRSIADSVQVETIADNGYPYRARMDRYTG